MKQFPISKIQEALKIAGFSDSDKIKYKEDIINLITERSTNNNFFYKYSDGKIKKFLIELGFPVEKDYFDDWPRDRFIKLIREEIEIYLKNS